MGIKEEIRTPVDEQAIPRRQPDGDPPVPPVQIPDDGTAAKLELSADSQGIITPQDLRDLLKAPDGAALVVEQGQARVVDGTAEGVVPVLNHADLATMLGGPGADPSDETLTQLAAGLETAVRSQHV